jgi:hypothetical protein
MIDASTQCPVCGSVELIPKARLVDRDSGSRYDLQVEVQRRPNAFLLKRPERTNLVATICGSCGHTQLRAEQPGLLYSAYRQAEVGTSDTAVEELAHTQEALRETQTRIYELEEKLTFLEALLQSPEQPRTLGKGSEGEQ